MENKRLEKYSERFDNDKSPIGNPDTWGNRWVDKKYYLLDSRAGALAVENDGKLETEDNGKYILLVGTLKECCKEANKGEYGEHCVVSDESYNILWELYTPSGHWSYKQFNKSNHEK